MLSFLLVATSLNMFMGSASAKWAVMAPVFVPMFMLLGYTPELTQAVYRIGDSCTNIISPMMSYFALIVSFVQRYSKDAGIGTVGDRDHAAVYRRLFGGVVSPAGGLAVAGNSNGTGGGVVFGAVSGFLKQQGPSGCLQTASAGTTERAFFSAYNRQAVATVCRQGASCKWQKSKKPLAFALCHLPPTGVVLLHPNLFLKNAGTS